ncbi:MAG: hypothetical protein EOO40_05760 [Deltaproteobacteria bacterium]|nr:MAG: hypothetical protein EOO40_05760 [Deltaproteobacteria bacterium]
MDAGSINNNTVRQHHTPFNEPQTFPKAGPSRTSIDASEIRPASERASAAGDASSPRPSLGAQCRAGASSIVGNLWSAGAAVCATLKRNKCISAAVLGVGVGLGFVATSTPLGAVVLGLSLLAATAAVVGETLAERARQRGDAASSDAAAPARPQAASSSKAAGPSEPRGHAPSKAAASSSSQQDDGDITVKLHGSHLP